MKLFWRVGHLEWICGRLTCEKNETTCKQSIINILPYLNFTLTWVQQTWTNSWYWAHSGDPMVSGTFDWCGVCLNGQNPANQEYCSDIMIENKRITRYSLPSPAFLVQVFMWKYSVHLNLNLTKVKKITFYFFVRKLKANNWKN